MPYTVTLVAIIVAASWLVYPLIDVRGVWRQLPTVLVLGVTIMHAWRTGDWGFNRRAFLPGLGLAAALTHPLALVLWMIGGQLGARPARDGVWLDLLYLIFWGGGQQLALQTVVLREAQQAAGRAAIPLAAAIFAGLHAPNPFLMIVTGAGALAWCWIYSRHPNIVPLALSHAVATLVILHAFDPEITGHLRTGWSYLVR